MAPGIPLVSRLAARRARTLARIDASIVGAVTEAELTRIEAILVRAHDRAGVPYGAPLPDGFIGPDEQARMDEILGAARQRSHGASTDLRGARHEVRPPAGERAGGGGRRGRDAAPASTMSGWSSPTATAASTASSSSRARSASRRSPR
jgi:hypothetical protein